MATEQDIHDQLGSTVCRRCINSHYSVHLEPKDCYYGIPYPCICDSCGQPHNIVTGLRMSGKLKLLFK